MDLENILKNIYPDENQINCLSGIVSTLNQILTNGSNILKVNVVAPAGSLGKNTILKGHLEVDCVYILEQDGYSFYHYFSEVIRCLSESSLKTVQFKTTRRSVSFSLKRPIGTIKVDLFAGFLINNPEQMYLAKNKDAYYGSTSLLQNKYFTNVKRRYQRFTDLVRLVKLWRNIRNIPLTSYMIELIVSNAIDRTPNGSEFPFYLEACFRTIQSFTDGIPIIPVFWAKYYDNSKIIWNYVPTKLYIIDPSDPSENIAEVISEKQKDYIRSETSFALSRLHQKDYSFLYYSPITKGVGGNRIHIV